MNHLKKHLSVAVDDGIDGFKDFGSGLLVDVDAVAVAGVVHQGQLHYIKKSLVLC